MRPDHYRGLTAFAPLSMAVSGGNFCDTDNDNDGLTDSYEEIVGTNPLLVYTDGDRFNNETEDSNGSDPLVSTSTPAHGDLNENGSVDAGDRLLAVRIATGLLTPSMQQLLRAVSLFPTEALPWRILF